MEAPAQKRLAPWNPDTPARMASHTPETSPPQYPPEGLPSPPDRLRGNSTGKSVKARRLLPGPGSRSAPLHLASEKSPRPHL